MVATRLSPSSIRDARTLHPNSNPKSYKRRIRGGSTSSRPLDVFPLSVLLRLTIVMASLRRMTGFALLRQPTSNTLHFGNDALYTLYRARSLFRRDDHQTLSMISSGSSLSVPSVETTLLATLATPTTYQIAFDLIVPEGRCVGLSLANVPDTHPDALRIEHVYNRLDGAAPVHWIHGCLHPDEVRYGEALKNHSHRQSFWLGRLAMRQALTWDPTREPSTSRHAKSLSHEECRRHSILKDAHGRPRVPQGFLGSISHKGTTGAALVAPAASWDVESVPRSGIGVDIEDASRAERRNIARKVLTPHEQATLGLIPGVSVAEEVLLRFSLKESVYKAMHPLICQFVSFQEAEIQPLSDGTAAVTLFLKSGAHTALETVEAHWCRHGDFFLSTSSVQLKEDEWRIRVQNGQRCQI